MTDPLRDGPGHGEREELPVVVPPCGRAGSGPGVLVGLCRSTGLLAFDVDGGRLDCCECEVVACPGVGVYRGVGQLDDVFVAVVGAIVVLWGYHFMTGRRTLR